MRGAHWPGYRVCVKETALDAIDRALSTTLLSLASRPVDPVEGERALASISDAGGRIEQQTDELWEVDRQCSQSAMVQQK